MPVPNKNPGFREVGLPATRPSSGEITDQIVWLPLLVLVLLVTWAWVKVLLCCAVIVSLSRIRSVSRSAMAGLLGLLFAAVYLLSPYWRVPAEAVRHPLGPIIGNTSAMVITAAVLLSAGAAWAWFSSGEVSRHRDKKYHTHYAELVAAAILAALIVVVNLAPLYYDIPVHGDEDWHIWRLRNLYMGLAPLFSGSNTAITLLAAIIAGLFLAIPRRPAVHIKVLILCATAVIAAVSSGFLDHEGMTYLAVRYPFFSCWLQQLGPVWRASLYDEGAYRWIPLVSVVAIGDLALRTLRRGGAGIVPAILAAVGIVTLPHLYYHATALYLELPAVALMTAALYYIERLLRDEPDALKTCPGWYALLAAGFIKETLAPMVAAVIVLRMIVRGWRMYIGSALKLRAVAAELGICLCIAAPLGIYLFFRGYFGDVRAYSPRFASLTDLSLYLVAGKALWAQFGLLLPLAAAGAVVAIHNRRGLLVVSLVLLWLTDFFFHFVDSPQFVGMARFNLLLFAPLAVLMLEFLVWLSSRPKHALVAVSILWIAANVAMSPVALGGEKKPYWISGDTMTSEFYFPKEDAVRWLKENRPGRPLAVGGAYTDTKIGWYFVKVGYRPQMAVIEARLKASAIDNLQGAIVAASSAGIPMVLYFRMTPGTELSEEEKTVFNYSATQVFRNRWLAIVVYEAGQAAGK